MLRSFDGLLLPALFMALASSASADIFLISRGGDAVLVFADDATGDVAPIRRIQGPMTQIVGSGNLNGVAVDVRNDEVFVSMRTNQILVFDLDADGNVPPLRTISGAATGLSFPASLAVDSIHDELYVVNLAANGLCVFPRGAAGNVSPLRVISGGATDIQQPTGVFVDLDADEVYLSNESSAAPGVNVFPRTGSGNITPLRQIMGAATTFDFAVGLFMNPATNELVVGDLLSAEVLTFPPNANGNIPPARVLSSPALGAPGGVTLAENGEMLVSDLGGNGLVGFDVLANGSSAPTREIRGSLTEISTPIYVASTTSPFPGAVYSSAPPATVVSRNGGANPASYMSSGAPVLGTTLTLSVDLSTTGNTSAVVVATNGPGNFVLPSGQVLLIGGVQVFRLGPAGGPVANLSVSVPLSLGLAGTTLYTQAVHLFGGPPLALSNALDLTAGI